MPIIDSFKKMIPGRSTQARIETHRVMRLKDGSTIDLSKKADRERFRKVVADLQRQTDFLAKRDLAEWRLAQQAAINVQQPNRQRLYDIYRDVELDLHLSGCIGQLQGFILGKAFKLTRPDGTPDEDALALFETAWFKQLLRYALQARYWGHSLIQLGDVTHREDGLMTFDGVELVPRKHVVPEYGRVTPLPGGNWETGIPYRESPYSDCLIEMGAPDDLGLYLKAAIQTIPKKYAMAFWDAFAEMFGLPIRIAKTASRDQKDIDEMAKMMETMGYQAYAVLPADAEIELKESSRGDAFNVYDKRVERANSELSKLILQVTMTIEDGSSLSQSQVHLKVLDNLIYEIADSLRDMVNDQLIPKMVKLGFPVKGLRFDWDDPIDYTPEQQLAFEQMILNNYEVDGSYFADKYGLPVGERRQDPFSMTPGGDGDSLQNARQGFFD